MGEAKNIVGIHDHLKKDDADAAGGKETLLSRLTTMIDDIDTAIQTKEKDVETEGVDAYEMNNLKVVKLKTADAMLRSARAILEDYDEGPKEDPREEVDPYAYICIGTIVEDNKSGIELEVEDIVDDDTLLDAYDDKRLVKMHVRGNEDIKHEEAIENVATDYTVVMP